MTTLPSSAASVHELGAFVRQQRQNANLSVRQLSALTGVSNPYLSQIERGLRRPSAEILQRLARGLSLSAESLYARAGLLDSSTVAPSPDVRRAIWHDSRLDTDQRRALLEAYDRFVDARADRRFVADQPDQDHTTKTLPKEHVMTSTSSEKKDPEAAQVVLDALSPLYAVVGASDLAVEKLRELGTKAAQDAGAGIDQLQDNAGSDVARVVKGVRQAPTAALNQALGAVAKGQKQYSELAERGKDVADKTRGGQAVDQAAATAAGLLSQAGALVEKSRSKVAGRTEKSRKAAAKTRDAAIHQMEHTKDQAAHAMDQAQQVVADQAGHLRDGVTEVARRGSEGVKPLARRRRTSDAVPAKAETKAPSVAGAGLEAGSTAPVAKRSGKKTASKRTVTTAGPAKPVTASVTPARDYVPPMPSNSRLPKLTESSKSS
ncbi:MAG: helix-turn-helix domain-containing protein [Dermatophilaceae bacterium]